jgi:hypothetical protein
VTKPTYPLPLYPFYYFFSFTQLSGQQTVHRKSIPHSYLNT